MNDEGVRDIYLPKGDWIDFYSGREFKGRQWLLQVHYSLAAIPVFVRSKTILPFYPELVSSTVQMNLKKVQYIQFPAHTEENASESIEPFNDFASSSLGRLCGITTEEIYVTFGSEER